MDVANQGRHNFGKHPGGRRKPKGQGLVLIMPSIIAKAEKLTVGRENGDMEIGFS